MRSLIHLRQATTHDVEAIRAVELAAGTMFADLGMDEIANDPPPPRRLLRTAIGRELLWVAVAGEDSTTGDVIGYGLGSPMDGHLHLEQVSVHPSLARRGIGADIFRALECQAVRGGKRVSTLFTFADVPWNAPYYQRLGYQELLASAHGPELAKALLLERQADGDGPPRIAMYKELVATQAT